MKHHFDEGMMEVWLLLVSVLAMGGLMVFLSMKGISIIPYI